MWIYAQKSGDLFQDGSLIGTGYSGFDNGKNNPQMQAVHNVGPIPQGDWTITGLRLTTATHGPFVLVLEPAATTNTFGRDGFLIHGDNSNHRASQGCIIMGRDIREQVWDSGDRDLQVVAELATQDLTEDKIA
jgi:hypothetical protein